MATHSNSNRPNSAQGASADDTPLMKQYWEIKAQAGDALLFFRMGDFYELFGDDAVEAARILEITLTSRDKNKANPLPMAGVPHHSAQGYVQKLLAVGKKVAIGEQMEDPAASKASGSKIVKRELTRVFTPAVQFDLEGSQPVYLACPVRASDKTWALACLDVSTGEALVGSGLSADALQAELQRLPIRHLLRSQAHGLNSSLELPPLAPSVLIEELPSNYLAADQARKTLLRHYEVGHLDAFLTDEASILALGLLVTYALRTQQREKLAHLRVPAPLRKSDALVLGPRSAEHLDLEELFQLINRTRSALGARQLRRWLHAPLTDPTEIQERQQSIRELAKTAQLADRLSSELSEVYDLERISGRIHAGLANPRDTLALGRTARALSKIAQALTFTQNSATLREGLTQSAAKLERLGSRILTGQREDAPLVARDGGIFTRGTDPELDRLLTLTDEGEKFLVDLESRERAATGIPSLKVRYNRVFGYYIEITSAHLKSVPSHYQRKQTMVGAERFFTEELKKFEEEILTASTKRRALEQELFERLLATIQEHTPAIMDAARLLGDIDARVALSRLFEGAGWVLPTVDRTRDLEIEAGRHPLIDRDGRGGFVPNSLKLSPQSRLSLLITGPNMGGKSTVMRQTALIVLLGQMGAPVPAAAARWGSVSAIHTRIGAHDAISRGQSTFMVEMTELAHILHHADDRSLIVLDEIGRGTSTYDGISVAWATLEWIARKIQARTLFATHYHELVKLADALPCLANAHMAVESDAKKGSLRFLYELREGPTSDSFGVHVAKLAGLPKQVVERAWEVLGELEAGAAGGVAAGAVPGGNPDQLSLFGAFAGGAATSSSAHSMGTVETEAEPQPVEPPAPHPVVVELENVDVNGITPIQALNFIARLQEISRESSAKSS